MDTLRPGMIHELALVTKGGVFISRSPLFRNGKKVHIAKRKISVYKPRRELRPGQIATDSALATDPQLNYRVTGKKDNYVDEIIAPAASTKQAAHRNIADGIGIRRAFLGKTGDRLDRRGITSRTAASAYDHAAVPTEKLVKAYQGMGYKKDRSEMIGMIASARTPENREVVRETLKNFVPMVRKPRVGSGKLAK